MPHGVLIYYFKDMPQPQNVFHQFITDIIAEAGFTAVSAEFKTAFHERMQLAFAKRLGIESVALLADPELLAFEAMLEKNAQPDPNHLYNFFAKSVPNFDAKLLEIMKKFRTEFLQSASAVTTKA